MPQTSSVSTTAWRNFFIPKNWPRRWRLRDVVSSQHSSPQPNLSRRVGSSGINLIPTLTDRLAVSHGAGPTTTSLELVESRKIWRFTSSKLQESRSFGHVTFRSRFDATRTWLNGSSLRQSTGSFWHCSMRCVTHLCRKSITMKRMEFGKSCKAALISTTGHCAKQDKH